MGIKKILKDFKRNPKKLKSKIKENNNLKSCVHDPVAIGSTLIASRKTCMVYPPEYIFVCNKCGKQFTYYKDKNGEFTRNIKDTSDYSN